MGQLIRLNIIHKKAWGIFSWGSFWSCIFYFNGQNILLLRNKISDKAHYLASKVVFIKNLAIWSFIDVYYEIISYELSVTQLGS